MFNMDLEHNILYKLLNSQNAKMIKFLNIALVDSG